MNTTTTTDPEDITAESLGYTTNDLDCDAISPHTDKALSTMIEARYPVGTKVELVDNRTGYQGHVGSTIRPNWSTTRTIAAIGRTGKNRGKVKVAYGRSSSYTDWVSVVTRTQLVKGGDYVAVDNLRTHDPAVSAMESAERMFADVPTLRGDEAVAALRACGAAWRAATPASEQRSRYDGSQTAPHWKDEYATFARGARVIVTAAGADGTLQPWFKTEATVIVGRVAYSGREDYALRFVGASANGTDMVGWAYGFQIEEVPA